MALIIYRYQTHCCDPDHLEALPHLSVDEPTISMTFNVNDSPFRQWREKFVTTRNIKDRLDQELLHNVALRVEQGDTLDKFIVSPRRTSLVTFLLKRGGRLRTRHL